jgi:hypothetical protein
VTATARTAPRLDLRPGQAPALSLAGSDSGAAPAQTGPGPAAPGTAIPGASGGANGALASSGQPGPAGSGGGTAGQKGGSPHPGCAPEDLILLTPAEREKCRNQIDAFNQRRANQNAAAEAARRVTLARGAPSVDGLRPEVRAYYDAVAAANDAAHNQINGGKLPGLACNLGALFGNGDKSLPADKIKIPGVPCVFVPPTGVLTEETRLTPP